MRQVDFCVCKISKPLQWLRIYRLYRSAFPRCERKPFRMIISMWRKGKTDVWYCAWQGRFAGFATTINDDHEQLVLLDYLAIEQDLRGQGIGSRILEVFKQAYAGKGLFVEIESPFEDGPDARERRQRKHFYEANGMLPVEVMAGVFGVKMELLCWNCRVNFERYHSFYRDNYSPWAADHIIEVEYPKTENRVLE